MFYRLVKYAGIAQAAFFSVDILSDEALRQGVKQYSDWPTYPQLYVKGELVGGCDIVTEMSVSYDWDSSPRIEGMILML